MVVVESSEDLIMNIKNICQKNPVTVRRSDDLLKAAQLMREKHIGYLVVVEPDVAHGAQRPIGVLTDRDIVITVVARETDPRSLRVEDIMTRQPVTASTADSIDKALQDMRRVGVRRLPVVGPRGELVGILSLDDVLEVLAGELQNVAGSIRNEQVIEGTLRS
jgi:CBS domain-containing protein